MKYIYNNIINHFNDSLNIKLLNNGSCVISMPFLFNNVPISISIYKYSNNIIVSDNNFIFYNARDQYALFNNCYFFELLNHFNFSFINNSISTISTYNNIPPNIYSITQIIIQANQLDSE